MQRYLNFERGHGYVESPNRANDPTCDKLVRMVGDVCHVNLISEIIDGPCTRIDAVFVGKISNLPEDLIHENSEQNTAEITETKVIMFTSERYEQSISSISKSIASPRN
jgi:hypothetical protein